MKLIADSGSTKTSWALITEEACYESDGLLTSVGINPVRDDEPTIARVLHDVCAMLPAKLVKEVHFYGAGCIPSKIPTMERLLRACFPAATVHVASDMLGAARALCGHSEGIACILGTGSNSCLYDGHDIVANVPALGWILGDEGSGAVLGRTLVSDLLKGQLPVVLRDAFLKEYYLTQDAIIQRVYRGEQPNRWLASLVPFLANHCDEPSVHDLLKRSFRRFLRRNVLAYARPDLPVGFVGGVANQFEDELRATVAAEGLLMGHIQREPIHGMVRYHTDG